MPRIGFEPTDGAATNIDVIFLVNKYCFLKYAADRHPKPLIVDYRLSHGMLCLEYSFLSE
jgi:hypothetical protein